MKKEPEEHPQTLICAATETGPSIIICRQLCIGHPKKKAPDASNHHETSSNLHRNIMLQNSFLTSVSNYICGWVLS